MLPGRHPEQYPQEDDGEAHLCCAVECLKGSDHSGNEGHGGRGITAEGSRRECWEMMTLRDQSSSTLIFIHPPP